MKVNSVLTALIIAVSGHAYGAISPEEAAQLGVALTPVGAIKEGNADGTIPPWAGGLTAKDAPADFKPDSGRWADPFAKEKPLFSITAQNVEQYGNKVSESVKEYLRRFPKTFRLDVYPTRRSIGFSEQFYALTKANATRCSVAEGGIALKGCFGGVPFPIPKTGHEVMWNVITAIRPYAARFLTQAVYVDANGTPIEAAIQDAKTLMPYHDPNGSLEEFEKEGQYYYKLIVQQKAPARISGDGALYAWTTDPVKNKNLGWQYQQGVRRARVIPDAQYDFPTLVSGGAAYYDEFSLFNGKMDKFDFKLLGKQEMYIPYNSQRTSYATKEQLTAAGGGRHPNPDYLRWELHRVWVVEATLKAGERHASAKRRYYIDEDYAGQGIVDSWDKAGQLHKMISTTTHMAYDKQVPVGQSWMVGDLSTGVIFYAGRINQPNHGLWIPASLPQNTFTPEALARQSAR